MADLDGHKWCVLRKNPQPTSGHASPEFVSIMPNDRLVVDPSHLLFIPNLLALQVLNRSPRFVGYAVHTSFFCLNQPKKNWTKKSSCNPSPLKLCPKKMVFPPLVAISQSWWRPVGISRLRGFTWFQSIWCLKMMNQWMERGVLLYFQVHNPNIISSCLEIPRMSLLFFKNPKCSWLPSGNQTWFALKSPMYGGFWKLEPPSWSGISSQLWLITGGYSFPNDMGNWRTVQSQI
jgi:hypothetical protein